MSTAVGDWAGLIEKVQYLLDRSEVLDCVSRYARGVDRHDAELLVSAYHPDGIDVHGNTVNQMANFAEWANALHDATFQRHTHCLTTHNCDIAGNTAHAESYVLFGLLTRDGQSVWLGCGRYIDRLEKRDGEWKIALRRTTVEWMVTADTAPMKTDYFLKQGYPFGAADRTDISFQRPLMLDVPAPGG